MQKLLGITGVKNVAATQLPTFHQAGGGAGIQALNFQFSHVVDVAFMNLQFVGDGGLRVVHLRDGANTGGHIPASAVQFLHRLQIIAKLNRVCILPCLEMNQWLQFLGREHRVAQPLDLREFVLTPRIDRDVDVNDRLLGVFLSDFGLSIGEGCFEIASLEINGKKILLRLNLKHGAQVFLIFKILGGGLK